MIWRALFSRSILILLTDNKWFDTPVAATETSKLWFGSYAHAFVQGNPKVTFSIERANLKIILFAFSENVVRWLKKTNKKRNFITKIIRILNFKYINHVQYLLKRHLFWGFSIIFLFWEKKQQLLCCRHDASLVEHKNLNVPISQNSRLILVAFNSQCVSSRHVQWKQKYLSRVYKTNDMDWKSHFFPGKRNPTVRALAS